MEQAESERSALYFILADLFREEEAEQKANCRIMEGICYFLANDVRMAEDLLNTPDIHPEDPLVKIFLALYRRNWSCRDELKKILHADISASDNGIILGVCEQIITKRRGNWNEFLMGLDLPAIGILNSFISRQAPLPPPAEAESLKNQFREWIRKNRVRYLYTTCFCWMDLLCMEAILEEGGTCICQPAFELSTLFGNSDWQTRLNAVKDKCEFFSSTSGLAITSVDVDEELFKMTNDFTADVVNGLALLQKNTASHLPIAGILANKAEIQKSALEALSEEQIIQSYMEVR